MYIKKKNISLQVLENILVNNFLFNFTFNIFHLVLLYFMKIYAF